MAKDTDFPSCFLFSIELFQDLSVRCTTQNDSSEEVLHLVLRIMGTSPQYVCLELAPGSLQYTLVSSDDKQA